MLSDIIIQKIATENGISFHDYMEMALYYPELGYYTTLPDKIGLNGDYYTSSDLTSLFGSLIGKQIEEMWVLLGECPFTIVEYGAGMGFLCRDILKYLKKNTKLYNHLTYCIIEKSPVMRQNEKEHLTEKVTWANSIIELGEVTGCILSNELLDNFAVHKVIMQSELMEVCVGYDNGYYEFLRPAPDALKNYFRQLNVQLSENFCTEINLEAVEWIKEIAAVLKRGYLMTIDYGYPSFDLYMGHRCEGTLLCYHKHTVNYQPYQHIGKQDITSHVNFSALYTYGIANGLEYCGYTDQKNFLLSLGFNHSFASVIQSAKPDNTMAHYHRIEVLHNFLNEMSRKFKVLIQQKGIQKNALSGLKFLLPFETEATARSYGYSQITE